MTLSRLPSKGQFLLFRLDYVTDFDPMTISLSKSPCTILRGAHGVLRYAVFTALSCL